MPNLVHVQSVGACPHIFYFLTLLTCPDRIVRRRNLVNEGHIQYLEDFWEMIQVPCFFFKDLKN